MDTNEAMVKAKWPDVDIGETYDHKWVVFDLTQGLAGEFIVIADTPEAAWADAAQRIRESEERDGK